jgi:membrane associated rhomboid family serine protease
MGTDRPEARTGTPVNEARNLPSSERDRGGAKRSRYRESAMTQVPEVPSTTCYRHPERETGRRCTRCGRSACPDCLQDAAVGAQCVECVKAAAPSKRQRVTVLARNEPLLATKIIIGINVVAFVVIGLRDARFDGLGQTSLDYVLFGPSVAHGEWYRIFTSSVVHFGFIHILFNMLLLWIVGQILEPGAGPVRFGLLYVASVAAGSAAALIWQPNAITAGASGGVFGVAAAATLVMQRQGVSFWNTGFGPLLVINLIADLWIPHVSLACHIGGAIGGLLAAEAMLQARKLGRPQLGLVGAALVTLVAVAIGLVAA